MNAIKIEKDNCIVKVNSKFYPKEIIEQAVKNFDKSLKINLNKQNEIVIKTKDESIGYEFCDYLLNIIQGGYF